MDSRKISANCVISIPAGTSLDTSLEVKDPLMVKIELDHIFLPPGQTATQWALSKMEEKSQESLSALGQNISDRAAANDAGKEFNFLRRFYKLHLKQEYYNENPTQFTQEIQDEILNELSAIMDEFHLKEKDETGQALVPVINLASSALTKCRTSFADTQLDSSKKIAAFTDAFMDAFKSIRSVTNLTTTEERRAGDETARVQASLFASYVQQGLLEHLLYKLREVEQTSNPEKRKTREIGEQYRMKLLTQLADLKKLQESVQSQFLLQAQESPSSSGPQSPTGAQSPSGRSVLPPSSPRSPSTRRFSVSPSARKTSVAEPGVPARRGTGLFHKKATSEDKRANSEALLQKITEMQQCTQEALDKLNQVLEVSLYEDPVKMTDKDKTASAERLENAARVCVTNYAEKSASITKDVGKTFAALTDHETFSQLKKIMSDVASTPRVGLNPGMLIDLHINVKTVPDSKDPTVHARLTIDAMFRPASGAPISIVDKTGKLMPVDPATLSPIGRVMRDRLKQKYDDSQFDFLFQVYQVHLKYLSGAEPAVIQKDLEAIVLAYNLDPGPNAKSKKDRDPNINTGPNAIKACIQKPLEIKNFNEAFYDVFKKSGHLTNLIASNEGTTNSAPAQRDLFAAFTEQGLLEPFHQSLKASEANTNPQKCVERNLGEEFYEDLEDQLVELISLEEKLKPSGITNLYRKAVSPELLQKITEMKQCLNVAKQELSERLKDSLYEDTSSMSDAEKAASAERLHATVETIRNGFKLSYAKLVQDTKTFEGPENKKVVEKLKKITSPIIGLRTKTIALDEMERRIDIYRQQRQG